MNYRKIYEEQTNEPIPENWEVHHIDLNRENNDIKNLVAMPKEMHIEFHSKLKKAEVAMKKLNIICGLDLFSGVNVFARENLHKLNEFIKIYNDCLQYIAYRDSLLLKAGWSYETIYGDI